MTHRTHRPNFLKFHFLTTIPAVDVAAIDVVGVIVAVAVVEVVSPDFALNGVERLKVVTILCRSTEFVIFVRLVFFHVA